MVKIVITGGGTGGHVFPGIAVAEAVTRKARDAEVLFIGGAEGFEAQAVPAAGYRFEAVPARGLLGKRVLAVPLALWTVLRGFVRAYRRIQAFDPDVVFATGGYVSGPVALAARLLGKPLVLHEQNSVPGITNRLLSRVAQEVHLNLASARKHFPRRRHLKLSGSPLRQGILEGDAARACQELGLDRDRVTVLVLAGSATICSSSSRPASTTAAGLSSACGRCRSGRPCGPSSRGWGTSIGWRTSSSRAPGR
jgi:UDP-N-acetylglucosamine--N-acetylmuramyl-(pentapeptide) pyrophosphoryl-undecaprenol N-acetylglucosamine transferase